MKRLRLSAWLTRLIRPGSLRMQLLSRTLLVMAVLLVLIGVFQYVLMEQSLIRNKAESLQSQLMAFPADLWLRSAEDVDKYGAENPKLSRGRMPVIPDGTVAFIDRQGKLSVLSQGTMSAAAPKLADESYRRLFDDRRWTYQRVTGEDGTEQLVVLQPIGDAVQPLELRRST